MTRLIPLHWRRIEKSVRHFGYRFIGQEGSHRKYWKQGCTRPIIIPHYDEVPKFIIQQIIKELAISKDEFYRYT
jgi:predicted RNA binding protein YcfA (HicA-like mRNA interferase family)